MMITEVFLINTKKLSMLTYLSISCFNLGEVLSCIKGTSVFQYAIINQYIKESFLQKFGSNPFDFLLVFVATLNSVKTQKPNLNYL